MSEPEASRNSSTSAMTPTPAGVDDERDARRRRRPWKDQEERKHQEVQQRAIAALQRPAWHLGPCARQVGPDDVGAERTNCDDRGSPQRCAPARERDQRAGQHREHHECPPVPRISVVAAIVNRPEEHQRDRRQRGHECKPVGEEPLHRR